MTILRTGACITCMLIAIHVHTAQLLEIFKKINYSERGSNSRKKEEDTFAKFVDYLDECERGKFISS